MSLKLAKSKKRSIYDYDDRIKRTFNLIEKELSQNNVDLIKKYDRLMILESFDQGRKRRHEFQYDDADAISESQAKNLIKNASKFVIKTKEILKI